MPDFNNPNPNAWEGHFVSQATGLYLDGYTGTITITSITASSIIGTFQFTGKDANDLDVSITEGSFRANLNP